LSNDIAAMNPSIVDLSQLNWEEKIRELEEEEVIRMLKKMIQKYWSCRAYW